MKLIDFGTARGHNRRCHTVAGVVFAKPGYVAPEVARQQVGDGRIDVYAIGVMLWEGCAGKRLLVGDAQKHLEDVAADRFEIPPLASSRGIPRELDIIIQKGARTIPTIATRAHRMPRPTSHVSSRKRRPARAANAAFGHASASS